MDDNRSETPLVNRRLHIEAYFGWAAASAILFWAFTYAAQSLQSDLAHEATDLVSVRRVLATGVGVLVLVAAFRATPVDETKRPLKAAYIPEWCIIGLLAVMLARAVYDYASTGTLAWDDVARWGLVWLGSFLVWVAGSRVLLRSGVIADPASAGHRVGVKQLPVRGEQSRLERRVYPEANVSGFPHHHQGVAFLTQVAALLRPDDVVLDFGAGRGAFADAGPQSYPAWLQNLRGRCAHVDGCDIDPAVLDNRTLDNASIMKSGEPLPYENERFDLIIARHVFEHIDDPEWAARELLRVLKPGGWICAMTPNKWGYVGVASRLVPNRLHAKVLAKVQPGRTFDNVFPTVYRLNRPSDVRRYFGQSADVYHYSTSAVPSYHFGSLALMRFLQLVHRLTPPMFDVGLRFFIRKR